MLLIDPQKQRRLNDAEEKEHRVRSTAEFEARHAHLVQDPRTSIANPERQRGRPMTTTQFAAKIRQLNPNLAVLPHPHNPTKACIWLNLPDHRREFVVTIENPWMPEWSIMGTMKTRVPDHPTRDIWKWKIIPGVELVRGWRTALLYLLRKNLITLEQVERTFGPGDRHSWAALTGKRKEHPVI